jgi:hypothetical protein
MDKKNLNDAKQLVREDEARRSGWLLAMLNGEVPDAQPLRSIAIKHALTAEQVNEAVTAAAREALKILDPVVDANMRGTSDAAALDVLLEAVNKQPLRWHFERKVERGTQTFELEPSLLYVPETVAELAMTLIADLMWRGELSRLRRCVVCRRYMVHGQGRKPAFCSEKCSAWHFNQKLHGEHRVRSRVVKLWRLARTPDIRLTDKDKQWIKETLQTDDIESAEFTKLRAQLAGIASNKKAIDHFIRELPQGLHDTLALPRVYEKSAKPRRGRKQAAKKRAQRGRKNGRGK